MRTDTAFDGRHRDSHSYAERSFAQRRAAQVCVNNRRLRFERLEDRRMLSGAPQLIDINPSPEQGSGPAYLVDVDGTLFFSAASTGGRGLWKSDGTQAGTVLIKEFESGINSFAPSFLTNVQGTLYFVGDDDVHGPALWKSDGTEAGTMLVKDIRSGTEGFFIAAPGFTDVEGVTHG
jgi:ELWxxDGT repeat protein